MEKNKTEYGARVERGIVETVYGYMYRVKSLDRYGVYGANISASGTYNVGDRVYFVLFEDGTGAILGAMSEVR